jgi:hypothetical protein
MATNAFEVSTVGVVTVWFRMTSGPPAEVRYV